jgi:alpha-beta hydrolase superfamily lysophospholipase
VHGYGEYCARYAYFARAFADAGYDFCGIDWRNFGYSVSDPKYAGVSESWETQVEDHMNFFEEYERQFGGVPQFLLGHS